MEPSSKKYIISLKYFQTEWICCETCWEIFLDNEQLILMWTSSISHYIIGNKKIRFSFHYKHHPILLICCLFILILTFFCLFCHCFCCHCCCCWWCCSPYNLFISTFFRYLGLFVKIILGGNSLHVRASCQCHSFLKPIS